MKTIKTLKQALKLVRNQVTAQQLLNGRINTTSKGWTDVKITEELKNNIVEQLVEIIGGHRKTKEAIENALKFRNVQHWALSRMIVEDYGNGANIRYCTGQDQPTEMQQTRNYIKNV
jgi:hypothetical protein